MDLYFVALLGLLFCGPLRERKREKGINKMMRLFNSFQIVALFAAAPWLLGLLYRQEFPWHSAACVAATVLYGIYTLGMVCLVYLGSGEVQ